VLAKSTPPHRMALTFSIKQTGVPAGTALAGLIVPPLTVAFGWPVAVAAIALGCVAVALAAQPLRAPLDSDRDRTAKLSGRALIAGLRLVARERALQLMALVSFVSRGMQMSVSGFIVAYLHLELGLGLVAAGTALTAANVAGVVGRIAWGSVSDRTGTPRIVLSVIGLHDGRRSAGRGALLASVAPRGDLRGRDRSRSHRDRLERCLPRGGRATRTGRPCRAGHRRLPFLYLRRRRRHSIPLWLAAARHRQLRSLFRSRRRLSATAVLL
jgi:MFS family permease